MKRWPKKPLGELCDVRIGRTPRRDEPRFWGGNSVWVTVGELKGGVIKFSKESVSDVAIRECMPEPVPTGTLLFSFKLSIGKMAVAGCPLYTNEAIAALPIRTPGVISREFLHYALLRGSHEGTANTAVMGKVLNKAKVEQLTIPVPPLGEQERIVKLLDEADELRKLRAQADTRTSQLIPALFHEMFLNTKMRDIVWPKVTLSELCSRVVDCPHSTPAYSARETPFHCVRSSDIQGGKFDWSSTKTVERDEYEERIAQLEPQAGDVVFCREGARLGNAAVIPNDRRVCLGQRMMLFRLNPSISTPYFLCSLILSQPIQNKIWTLVGGSASPHLNVRDIKDFLTDLPPLALQQEFDRRVNEIRAFEAAQTASRRRTEDLFQSMLHKAFNGEL